MPYLNINRQIGYAENIDNPIIVNFTTTIPFTKMITNIDEHVMTEPITFTPNTTGAKSGYGAIVRVVANGVDNVDTTAFKKVNGSPSFINVNGVVNVFVFLFDGIDYRVAILQNEADAIASLQPPTLTLGAVGINTIIVNWNNVPNETGYTLQIATNTGFTEGLQTVAKSVDVISHTFSSLADATKYYIRVLATGDGINFLSSAWSNTLSPTTSEIGSEVLVHEHVFNSTNGFGSWLDFPQNSGASQIITHQEVSKAVAYTQATDDTARRYLNDPTFYNIGDTLRIKIFGVVQTGNGGTFYVADRPAQALTSDGTIDFTVNTTGANARHIYIGVVQHSAVLYWEKIEIYKL